MLKRFNRQPGIAIFLGTTAAEGGDGYKELLINGGLTPDDGLSSDIRQILVVDSAPGTYKHLRPDETYTFPNMAVASIYSALNSNANTHDRAQALRGKAGDTRTGCAGDQCIGDGLAVIRKKDIRRMLTQKVLAARNAAAFRAASQNHQDVQVAGKTTVALIFATYGGTGSSIFPHFTLLAHEVLAEQGADYEMIAIAIGASAGHGTDADTRYGNMLSVVSQIDFAHKYPDKVEIPTLDRPLRLPPGRRLLDRAYYLTGKNMFVQLGMDRACVTAAVSRAVWHLFEGEYAPQAATFYRDFEDEFQRCGRPFATLGLSVLKWDQDRARRWVQLRGTKMICDQLLNGSGSTAPN